MTLSLSILTALFCMTVVFAVLIGLWGIIRLFSVIIGVMERRNGKASFSSKPRFK